MVEAEYHDISLIFEKDTATAGHYIIRKGREITDYIKADLTEGWNTERYAFWLAARAFNALVPAKETIPCF